MIKIIISCVLIVSVGGIGILKARGLSERSKLLEEYIAFLQLLITELNYSNFSAISIPEILNKYSCNGKSKVGCLCKLVIERIEDEEPLDLAFNNAFEKIYDKSILNNGDKETMKSTGEYLGRFAIKGQEELLIIQKEKLLAILSEAYNEEKIKGKMYKSLGFYIGTCLAIILM